MGVIETRKILYLGQPEVSFWREMDKDGLLIEYGNREVQFLRMGGFGVDVSRNASDAYGSLMLNNDYAAFVMDLESHPGNLRINNDWKYGRVGVELFSKLRDAHIDVPVIVTSNITSSALNTWFEKNGALGVLKQPTNLDDFLSYVKPVNV